MSADGEQQNGHTCAAFGCPLPGAFRGFGLGDGWWCFIHAAGSCDLQATTQRINTNAGAIRTVLRASNLGAQGRRCRYCGDSTARAQMTLRDEILAMAREAHRQLVTSDYPGHTGQLDPWTIALLERFFRLAQAAAYERAAEKINATGRQCVAEDTDPHPFYWAAAEIRALKEQS